MATILNPPPSNNAISVFAYEGFNFVISNPNPAVYTTLQPVSNTTGFGVSPSPLYFTKVDNSFIRFSISDLSNNLTPGTTESFKVTVTDASLNSLVSSNTVTIGAGRFLDGSGQSLSNNSYTFFKNETITPIQLVAPSFTLATPTSIPALPPGLSFSNVASNIFVIRGTPLLPIANSNYQIIGVQSGGSKIVTTRINMVISNERLRVNLSGSSIIESAGMVVGTPIATRVITSIPPATGGLVRYTYPALPDGIVVKDSSGTVQPGTTFVATDASYTMVIEGTPTLAAANAFRNAGADSNGLLYTVTATRFSISPPLSNTQALTFKFGETVLFDTPTLDPALYVGVPVDMTRNFFRAQTYFTSNVGISNIFSTNLRTDLSLVYTPGSDRADLSGTPLSAGTATYTIRAINSNAKQTDLSASIAVVNDTITFVSPPTPAVDACYSFILSRPLTSFKPGYYESNIQFRATAASQLPVTLSAPGLAGTGLSLDASGSIVGLPSQVTPLTTLTVTANAIGSPATLTRNIKFSIVNDTFFFTDVSSSQLSFIENIPIAPFRFPVTTLSERNIIGYTQTGFPAGLSINSAGVVSGIPTAASPTAGNVTIRATTGYASGSRDFSYTIVPDDLLLTAPQSFYSYTAGDPVSIQITGTSYSGATVSNYGLTIPAPYGIGIGSTSGLISGTWTDSIPPNQILPASLAFFVTGEVGDTSASSLVSLTASPIIQNTSFVWASQRLYSSNPTTSWVVNSNVPNSFAAFDIVIQNSNVDGNFILATASNSIYRSTNANGFSGVLVGGVANDYQLVSSLASKPNTTTWWASGTRVQSDLVRRANILQSDDNGVTWYQLTTLKSTTSSSELSARDNNASGGANPYLLAGVALKYNSDVMMAGGLTDGMGGPSMLRSVDDGASWSNVNGDFAIETAYFNLDVPNMWIATGSSGYRSLDTSHVYVSPTDTIKYSTDQGDKWSNATGGFNMFGYELVYANNTWVASGVDGSGSTPYQAYLKYSTNGTTWSDVSGVPAIDVSSAFVPINTPAPEPVTSYDFNYYSAGASTISNQVTGLIGSASISLPSFNTYVTSSPLNKYLTIYAPNNFPGLTGGITAPSIAGVYSVEMWVRLDVNGSYGQYFIDFRTGQSGGYIIGTLSGASGAVGPDWVGQTIYYNKAPQAMSAIHNPVTYLYLNGWTQVVLVSSTPFTDDMTFFARFTNQQGMPISVAEISIYDTALTSQDVQVLFNQKCLRYGLAPSQQLSETIAPLRIGSMNYDGSNWNVFRRQKDASNNWSSTVYSSSDIASGSWTTAVVTSTFSNATNDADKRFVTYTRPQYLRPSDSRTIDILLSFAGAIGGGPTISPDSSGFLLYQYVAMSLQLSALGTGTIYFFISSAELPPGLTFDPIANVISGSPVQNGTFSTRVYAKDDNGVSLVTYTFTVNIPRIVRKQDGAGAYTSLLKQYTEVLAAQSARDSRALPAQEAHLGEFMSPVPVAVTTKTFSTNCQNCLRQECPASNIIVDANGGASSTVCAFIDANDGEVFDAGNAGGNICD